MAVGLAAQINAWGARWPASGYGLPEASAGSPVGGVPFKLAPLLALYPNARLIVEASFGADLRADPASWLWTDITVDVRQADGQRVAISPMGRSDESSAAQPAGCTFQLKNTAGDYTAYRAASRWHPFIRRNTPIRVTVNLTGYLNDNSVRFFGYANGWRPWWDESAKCAVVTVSASGVLRRLRQGKRGKTVKSPWKRYLLSQTVQPIAYWTCEDSSDAAQAASALVGGTPMAASGGDGGSSGVRFASGTTRTQPLWTGFEILAPATLPLVSLGGGGSLSGVVPTSAPATTQWTVQFVGRLWAYTGFAGTDITLARWTTPGGTFAWWAVKMLSLDGGFQLVGSDGTVVVSPPITFPDLVHFRIQVTQNGGNVDASMRISRVTSTAEYGTLATGSVAGTLAMPTTFVANPDYAVLSSDPVGGSENQANDIVIGHIHIYDTITSVPALVATGTASDTGNVISPWTGFLGETATARLTRLFRQEGVSIAITGTSDVTMGAEPTDSFLNLVDECVTADHGLLFDGRGPGCGYIARSEIYNQTATLTVDASAGQIPAGTFEPADDDQRSKNLVIGTRKGGTSQPYEDTDGPLGTDEIGTYDDDLDVNLDDEDDVVQHAAWDVHLGTVEGFRYPTLPLDVAGVAPELAANWAAMRLLNRIDVTNVSSRAIQHPPGTVSLIAEGWAEQLSPYMWRATTNCSPYGPWEVGELDDSGFLDCGGSTLNEELDATETGVDVLITDVCIWDHSDGDFVIVIGDEEMTVTNVSAASGSYPAQTQTLTVTRSVNGVVQQHPVGAEVHVRDGFVLAL